jgi:hypothetical protein
MITELKENLYMVLLQATDENAVMHLYMFTSVAVSEQDAFTKGVVDCQTKNPMVFAIAQSNGGFKQIGCQMMERSNLESVYRKIMTGHEGETKLVNLLLQHIIETGDKKLFEKISPSLSTFDQKLVQDRIYGFSVPANP